MRWANGWIAEVDEDDPDKIKDNLMDLSLRPQAGRIRFRSSFDEMLPTPQPQVRLIALLE